MAGFIDSVAGGGGLITLPALIAVNVPPYIALGTNKFQSTIGTSFALMNFHRKAKVVWKLATIGIPFALIASVVGARLALVIPASILAKVIVVLIPPLAIFIFFSWQTAGGRRPTLDVGHSAPMANNKLKSWLTTIAVCSFIGLYDGFLGPGTGTFLIIALVIFSRIPLLNASATAKTFNLASNIGALATFLISGYVYFPYALAMAGANIAGNITGSHYAMKHGHGFIQKVLLVSLTLLFGYLIWKYF